MIMYPQFKEDGNLEDWWANMLKYCSDEKISPIQYLAMHDAIINKDCIIFKTKRTALAMQKKFACTV